MSLTLGFSVAVLLRGFFAGGGMYAAASGSTQISGYPSLYEFRSSEKENVRPAIR